jgi:hypothetical protein
MGGIRTRRLAALVAAGVLAAAVVGPVSAATSGSSRSTIYVAQAIWGSLDEETLAGNLAAVGLIQVDGEPAELAYEAYGITAITCTQGTSTTLDDVPGIRGAVAFGSALPAAMTFDLRRLGSASASGTVTVQWHHVNSCTDEDTIVLTRDLAVTLDLTAAGAIQRDRDRFRFVEPGVFMELAHLSLAMRPATGTASVAGVTHAIGPAEGLIGRATERVHVIFR